MREFSLPREQFTAEFRKRVRDSIRLHAFAFDPDGRNIALILDRFHISGEVDGQLSCRVIFYETSALEPQKNYTLIEPTLINIIFGGSTPRVVLMAK